MRGRAAFNDQLFLSCGSFSRVNQAIFSTKQIQKSKTLNDFEQLLVPKQGFSASVQKIQKIKF